MPITFHYSPELGTEFALWKIEESEEELYGRLQLREHELAFLAMLDKGKRYLHWLSTRVCLRTLLNTSDYIDARVDDHGKPYLANFPHFISLSHSYDYAAVMISKNHPVGIDIELIKEKVVTVSHKFMQDQELEFIDSHYELEHLYACWCAKEAIFKWHGKTGISFKDHISIQPFSYTEKGSLTAFITKPDEQREFTVWYEKFDDYMLGYTF